MESGATAEVAKRRKETDIGSFKGRRVGNDRPLPWRHMSDGVGTRHGEWQAKRKLTTRLIPERNPSGIGYFGMAFADVPNVRSPARSLNVPFRAMTQCP